MHDCMLKHGFSVGSEPGQEDGVHQRQWLHSFHRLRRDIGHAIVVERCYPRLSTAMFNSTHWPETPPSCMLAN